MFTIIPEPGAGASLSSPGFTGPEKKTMEENNNCEQSKDLVTDKQIWEY